MLTCYGILLAQLKLPEEAILLAVALDVIMDFVMTGVDVLMLQLELVNQAQALNMLNHAKLSKP